jgi:GNAT superfamily N-acetyltransferase
MSFEVRELGGGETGRCYEAMAALRGELLGSRAQFVERVDTVMRPAGYRLLGSFEPGAEEASAVAGFRLSEALAWGRHLYVDDLSTLGRARGQGHADGLIAWLLEEARRVGAGQLHLDSGVGAERFDAHRFYHAHGLSITAHHFGRAV